MLIAPFDDNFDVVIVGTGSVDPRAPSAIELWALGERLGANVVHLFRHGHGEHLRA
jgi:hypothetical protein